MISALKKWRVRFALALALIVTAFITWASVDHDRTTEFVLLATVNGCYVVGGDKRIDVASDTVAVGFDNWIVSFKVDSIVSGDFPSEELNVLVHSPSEFGVQAPGDRFKLQLRRRTSDIHVIGSSNEALSHGLAQLSFAECTYESLTIIRRP
jgi:hypothetical protein